MRGQPQSSPPQAVGSKAHNRSSLSHPQAEAESIQLESIATNIGGQSCAKGRHEAQPDRRSERPHRHGPGKQCLPSRGFVA
jgi:hypothetical protein